MLHNTRGPGRNRFISKSTSPKQNREKRLMIYNDYSFGQPRDHIVRTLWAHELSKVR